MELDGAHAYVEFLADFGVCLPACDCEEHFFFAFCKGFQGLDWDGREGVGREAARSRAVTPGSMSASPRTAAWMAWIS